MIASQARGLAVPDAVALSSQGRTGRPGPWLDALLGLLQAFRDLVPPVLRDSRPGPLKKPDVPVAAGEQPVL